jgi:PAS domain S-box-containing protein
MNNCLPNVLIVDDNKVTLIFLEIILGKLQLNLIKAESGFEALEKSKGQELAVAILDIQMPEMNGFELAIKLNENRGSDKVPIIFVTAIYVNDLDVSQGYNCGAVDYIFKPINSQILLSKVSIFLDIFNYKQTIIRKSEQLEKKAEELIQVNAALKESEEKYRSYIDNAPDGVFVTDEVGRFIEVNKAACLLSGYSNDELLARNFLDLLPEESMNEWNDHFQNLDVTNSATVELLFCHENGLKRWCNIEAVKLSENRRLGFVKDITKRKVAEYQLKESESNLAMAQRIAHIGSWKWENSEKILKLSKEMFSIFDINADIFDGKSESLLKMLHPDDLEPILSSISKSKSNGDKSNTFEFRVIHKDNSIHYLFGEIRIEYDKVGTIRNYFGIVQDISERKLAEQLLKISEEKYRTMLNASPDGILLIDLDKIIIEVSEIALELFDTDNRFDMVGNNFYQFIPANETNTMNDIFEKTVSEGLAQNVELKIMKKNQSIFQGEISSTLIQAPDGEPLSFMFILRDISQRKKIETKQFHADRMANLGEMASGIAHEINQPLNIISMVMDKILFEAVKAEAISYKFLKNKSDKIFDNITRIRNIIDHVRAFSRSDDNYVSTAFDINTSIENATSLMMEQFKHLEINVSLQLDYAVPQLIGNTFKFEQVIVNLMTNAKDAVLERRIRQEDYSELKVEIKTYRENQFLIIEITDNGIGIGKDDIHNVMLPFYTTKEEGKGTGLGLSICYQIIKEMNGTIDISSDGKSGTKIRIALNIQKSN